MTTYYISAGIYPWFATRARTLRGAMRVAMRTFHLSRDGTISIAIERHGAHETIATRHGYDRWVKQP